MCRSTTACAQPPTNVDGERVAILEMELDEAQAALEVARA